MLFLIKNWVLDLLFPRECLGCGEEGAFLCSGCEGTLYFVPPSCITCRKLVPEKGKVTGGRTCASCADKSHIYAFLSPFQYENELIRALIYGLKYNRVRDIAPVCAALLEKYFKKFGAALPEEAILVPIPLHKKKERVRGFNQAEEIAKSLAGAIPQFRLEGNILVRNKNTSPQVNLSGRARQENVAGAIFVKDAEKVKDRVVILLDDVKTTGATLEEAARVLKEAGVKRVWAITLAH